MIVVLFLEKYLWIFRITTYCDDFNFKSSVKQVKIVFLSFQICYTSYIDDNCIILSSNFLNIPRNIRNTQRLCFPFQRYPSSAQCSSVCWVSSDASKGCLFDFPLGHMPCLQAQSGQEACRRKPINVSLSCECFSLSFSV